MKEYFEKVFIINSRMYALRIYENEKFVLDKIKEKDCLVNASLFIYDKKNKVSNKQPMNNQELMLRKNVDFCELISSLALNYDEDISKLKVIHKNLLRKVFKKDEKIFIPETQQEGKLPL